MELWLLDQEQETTEPSEQQDLIASSSESACAAAVLTRSSVGPVMTTCREMRVPTCSVLATAPLVRMQLHFDLQPHACRKCGDFGTSPRRFHPSARALSYWRTGCRVLGKVLGEITRRLEKPLVKPNSGQESAEIAPRRSPVRVRLAP